MFGRFYCECSLIIRLQLEIIRKFVSSQVSWINFVSLIFDLKVILTCHGIPPHNTRSNVSVQSVHVSLVTLKAEENYFVLCNYLIATKLDIQKCQNTLNSSYLPVHEDIGTDLISVLSDVIIYGIDK